MISIYKNESFLIEDKVKEYFKKYYKHLDLSMMYEEINDLITGYVVVIKENKLNIQRQFYITTKDFDGYKDAIDKIMGSINTELYHMINGYYFNSPLYK